MNTLKNKLMFSQTGSFNRKYHFIKTLDCIEMWVEKFSACYDTGHRFNLMVGFEKGYKEYFEHVVKTFQ